MNKPFIHLVALCLIAIVGAALAEGPKDGAKDADEGKHRKDELKWPPAVSKEEADKYDRLISSLRAVGPRGDHKEFARASDALQDAGMRAFSSLLARLGDQTKTDIAIDAAAKNRDGSYTYGYYETIGDVCWGIFEEQIEGADPWGTKGHDVFQDFYVLRGNTARGWLDAHKGMSLPQLQLIARKAALKGAESQLEKDPKDRWARAAVSFFKREVAAMEADERDRKESAERAEKSKVAKPPATDGTAVRAG
jgi:hypothetical protein